MIPNSYMKNSKQPLMQDTLIKNQARIAAELPFVRSDLDNFDDSIIGYLKRHGRLWKTLTWIAIAVSLMISSDIYLGLQSAGDVLAISAIVAGFYLASIQKKMDTAYIKHFAEIMKYSFLPKFSLGSVDAALFETGMGNTVNGAASGTYAGKRTHFFEDSFSVETGRTTTTLYHTVLEITFSKTIPTLGVFSISETELVVLAAAEAMTHISLEGNFNKYFSVYAPHGDQVLALQVLAPNLMAELMENYGMLSFELKKDKLYIYRSGAAAGMKSKDILELYALADRLIPIIEKIQK